MQNRYVNYITLRRYLELGHSHRNLSPEIMPYNRPNCTRIYMIIINYFLAVVLYYRL